jgi:hypothetical protein
LIGCFEYSPGFGFTGCFETLVFFATIMILLIRGYAFDHSIRKTPHPKAGGFSMKVVKTT